MKRSKSIKAALLAFAAIAAIGLVSSDASARVFVGGGVILGAPTYYYPPYYAYPYQMYAPAPAYYPPPIASQYPSYQDQSERYCREYTHTAVIDGKTQNIYGTACQQPDGTWQMVN